MAAPISTTYTPEERKNAINHVLGQVASGESVAAALRNSAPCDLPSAYTFWQWHLQDEQLQIDLARARLNGVEVHMEALVDIADEANADVYIDHRADGTPVARIDGEAIARSKLKIEARIKRAQMIAPRKYGLKLDMTSDGQQIGAVNEAQRIAKAAALMRQAKHATIDQPVITDRLRDILS